MFAVPAGRSSGELRADEELVPFDSTNTQAMLSTRTNPLISEPRLGIRIKMAIFLVAGALAGVVHDRFYSFLNGRNADHGIFTSLRTSFSDQSLVNLFANIIAKVGGGCFAAVVTSAFVQVFWGNLSHHAANLQDITGITRLANNPFDLTSWSSICAMRSLTAIVVVASLMQLVSIFTPGSLTVAPVTHDERCSYDIVDLHQDNSTTVDMAPRVPTSSLVARTLMSGTYVPPSRLCQSCEYNVTFLAPAIQCENVTQSVSLFPLTGLDMPNDAILGMWSSYPIIHDTPPPPNETGFDLWVYSRNFPGDSPDKAPAPDDCSVVALRCSGWIAEYSVHVEHSAASTASVMKVTTRRPLTFNDSDGSMSPTQPPDSQIAGFWSAYIDVLTANISMSFSGGFGAGPTWDGSGSENRWLCWSVFGRGSSTMPWRWPWPNDLRITVPAVMENVSLSLLAGVDAGFSTTMRNTTDCRVTSLQYVYSRARLLGTYGTGLALAAVCLLWGFFARWNSPRSESLDFARILAAYPLGDQLHLEDDVITDGDGVLRKLPKREV